jgi:DNA modification methylase
MKPYFEADGITIYHGDSKEILTMLGTFDLLLTDPPYGIKQDKGFGGDVFNTTRKAATPSRRYKSDFWDSKRPSKKMMRKCLLSAKIHIIWGGNYFTDYLPQRNKWLAWDKENNMPTLSDAELAWTSLPGNSVKMLTYNGAGMLAKEKNRVHPTQKPLALFQWCIMQAKDIETIIDPFAGSGTTGEAAKVLGKRATLIEREERYCEHAARRLDQCLLKF